MSTDNEISRQYRGYVITRRENGLINCGINEWPGHKFYYVITKNGYDVMQVSTLKKAKMLVDARINRKNNKSTNLLMALAALKNAVEEK